jgi:DNA polymerase
MIITDCKKCKLHNTRTNIVIGSGSITADIMFVGEAPGATEDATGVPFCGQSGKMLDKYIKVLGVKREDVYIANICKCRPPSNRNPEPDEISACTPYLISQIAEVKPKVIITLGKFAAQFLSGKSNAISVLRGKWHSYQGVPLMATWHPAYVIRNNSAGNDVFDDMELVSRFLKVI